MLSTLSLTSLLIAWVAETPSPNWQRDYHTAYSIAAEQKKPLAVFLGHGKDGIKTLVADGGLSTSDAKILGEAFVPVYVDTDTPAGKELAKSFEMTEGLVISDRTGGLQAVRFDGPVPSTELNQMLTTYSTPTRTVATTEYRGRSRGPIMTFITNPDRSRPIQTIIYGGSTGGTCKNGNCPR